MGRPHDITIPDRTSWLHDPAAQQVCGAIRYTGFDVFFVGGCVRNALLGVADSDIDLATPATPEQVIAAANEAGLRSVPTGIDHGTVTIVADDAAFEVTTFRKDVETDGRHAVVAFSEDIQDDARRRDFTMNALYATPEGQVIDPLGGMPDLLARRVKFIEDPVARIKEDFLRILRYYRFSAQFADPAEGFDPDALGAIASNLSGLETLSAERIGQEMSKLLSSADPAPALASMRQTGVLATILPGSDDKFIAPLVHFEGKLKLAPNWIARLALLGGEDAGARLRLSKAQSRELSLLTQLGFAGPTLDEIAYRHGVEMAFGAMLMRAVVEERVPEKVLLETLLAASEKVFPVTSSDLIPRFEGPALGAKLKELEQRWIESGFALTRDQLLAKL